MQQQKKIAIINAALMSGLMSFLLSGFFTWYSIGARWAWIEAWAVGFALAWPLSLGLVLLVGGRVRRIAARLAGEA